MAASQPHLKYVCECLVELAITLDNDTRSRSIPIVGGLVQGQRLRGRIFDPGSGARAVFSGSFGEVDSSYDVQTHDGAVIRMRNFGLRHSPEHVREALSRGEAIDSPEHYVRTHPRFETGDPRYAWLNGLIAVGSGARARRGLYLTIYEVL